jgi:thiol-disulfide isomerase/thioredoxin
MWERAMCDDLAGRFDRRTFLRTAAAALAAARSDVLRSCKDSHSMERLELADELAALGKATGWINSPALTGESLKGKVVLVQFWTFTCINWLRTLPYIRAWAQSYKDAGLVVIGVHTPEFAFEHNLDNVRRATKNLSVAYPVAVDSDYAIWRAFNNQYWPALYVFDTKGHVRHHQFGEGKYAESERMIQQLLTDAGGRAPSGQHASIDGRGLEAAADWADLRSPENYVGSARSENFASPGGAARGRRGAYKLPQELRLNEWALEGDWTVEEHSIVLNQPNGRIAYRFRSRDLHLVMGPPAGAHTVRFRVVLDGQSLREAHGLDVDEQGNGVATEQRLYQLIRQTKPIVDRVFQIELLDSGVEVFAFTFG